MRSAQSLALCAYAARSCCVTPELHQESYQQGTHVAKSRPLVTARSGSSSGGDKPPKQLQLQHANALATVRATSIPASSQLDAVMSVR